MLESNKKYSDLEGVYVSKDEAENAQLPPFSMVYHPAMRQMSILVVNRK